MASVDWVSVATIMNSVATVVLVFVTAVYVYITHKLLKSAQDNDIFQKKALTKQLQIQKLPDLYLDIYRRECLEIEITNAGSNGAYDVDLFIIPILSSNDYEISNLLHDVHIGKLQDKIKNIEENLVDGHLFGVCHRRMYPVFPPKRKNIAKVNAPYSISSAYALLQYRDSISTNYVRAMYYGALDDSYERLPLISIDPITVKPIKRLDVLERSENNKIKKKYPLFDEFFDYLDASIPSGYINLSAFAEIEDSGEWYEL